MKQTTSLVLGVILGFLAGMGMVYILARGQNTPKISEIYGDSSEIETIKIGSLAPPFELDSLNGTRKLDDYRERIVLINFWATWCGPCRLEMPLFQKMADKYPEDLVVLAVNAQDTKEDILGFMNELSINFDVLLDVNGQVHKQYLVRGFPTTIFVDKDGVVKIQHIGLITEKQMMTYLNDLGL